MQVLNSNSLSICGCPGELWEISVNNKPSVSFTVAGDSKRVMFSKYGFSIPETAYILGIEIEFDFNTNANPNTLEDKSVNLLYWGNIGGFDKSTATPAYTGSNTIVLGGPADTWGWYFAPADINNDGFGFNFKLNSTTTGVHFEFLRGAQITVYYQNPSGIIESQKNYSDTKILLHNKQIEFNSAYDKEAEIRIYNLAGNKLIDLHQNANTSKQADLSTLENGVYIYTIKQNGKVKSGKFLLD